MSGFMAFMAMGLTEFMGFMAAAMGLGNEPMFKGLTP
jgi:hypothetical protein